MATKYVGGSGPEVPAGAASPLYQRDSGVGASVQGALGTDVSLKTPDSPSPNDPESFLAESVDLKTPGAAPAGLDVDTAPEGPVSS